MESLEEKGIKEGIWKKYCPVKYSEIPSQLVTGTIENAVIYRVIFTLDFLYYQNKLYYLSSPEAADAFVKTPNKYLKNRPIPNESIIIIGHPLSNHEKYIEKCKKL